MRIVVPLAFAAALFVLNNLAVWSGWLKPPTGYVSRLMIRGEDIAQYLTWLPAFQSQTLIPDYHAPYQTEPALFNPFLWFLARTCHLLGVDLAAGYQFFHFLFYIIAAYALCFALRVFTDSRKEAWMALLLMFCAVPLQSLAILPAFTLSLGAWRPLVGIGDFVWWSSDGFFHGISGGILVTFGTATTILAFAFLGQYFKAERKRDLIAASFTTFVSALIHPFEVTVIAGAGSCALLLRRGREWPLAIREMGILSTAAALGLAPYMFLAWRHTWLREAAAMNHWWPGTPLRVLVMLGLPTILTLTFLIVKRKMKAKTDLLLQAWFVGVLVGIYIPWQIWSQHLFDGFHYVTGLLLARYLFQSSIVARSRQAAPRFSLVVLAVWCCLSAAPYVAFHLQSFRDGCKAKPERLFSSVFPQDELAAVEWLRRNGRPEQLVLAPLDHAPWFATAPMHSFASHWLFSLNYQEQAQLARQFYSGGFNPSSARKMLNEYGIRYVIAPEDSQANDYLKNEIFRAKFGSLLIYELTGRSMKVYSGLPRD